MEILCRCPKEWHSIHKNPPEIYWPMERVGGDNYKCSRCGHKVQVKR